MLKMIIADDERVIRESISCLIDWEKLGVELAGLCRNGLEAYDMIIDEAPDIVLTDIRMPGMDGLELIRKVSLMDLDTCFIILSGYGEFEYAKEAMKYGVRHYVLKPCNKSLISDCIVDVAKDCYARKRTRSLEDGHFLLTSSMHHNIVSSVISESLGQNKALPEIIRSYEPYLDFYSTPYQLFYVFYLEIGSLEVFLQELKHYCEQTMLQITIHGTYVHNTLLLFFKDYSADCGMLEQFIKQLALPIKPVELEIQKETYHSLCELLEVILVKLKRFSIIYYLNNFHLLYTCNYNYLMSEAERLYQELKSGSQDSFQSLSELLLGIEDTAFLKQLSGSLLLKASADNPAFSAINLTEWLFEIDAEADPAKLKSRILDHLKRLLLLPPKDTNTSSMIDQITTYVEQNLSNSGLTLKFISEQVLFMNVDYVSKRFFKEAGRRFSDYLTDIRIMRAKEYIAAGEKIQIIAEKVGCGNNPHYFSQLFKKKTGMTPSAYSDSLRK
ncbi:response regulator transcription factor [Hungatella hominis]|uniref:Stage 0 sporulation protein A homolog n=1 Tax=Hungatella hominis TaxID=2763050 RepID=A0ABR7H8S3_9FIRM|nr:response regulator [Hungatella hominis]MBC5709541.1 response regulator [Hungatella hominis]